MSQIVFYRQERYDGGVRAGIEVNGERVWHTFTPGALDSNPALLWYVDLNVEGESLPIDSETARRWLLDHGEVFKRGLEEAAGQLEIGLDADEPWPYVLPLSGGPPGVEARLTVSGVRGLGDGELAEKLKETCREWSEILSAMHLYVGV